MSKTSRNSRRRTSTSASFLTGVNRDKLEIAASILECIKKMQGFDDKFYEVTRTAGGRASSPTYRIIHSVGMSNRNLKSYLNAMLNLNLIEQKELHFKKAGLASRLKDKNKIRTVKVFTVTDKGLKFLELYHELQSLVVITTPSPAPPTTTRAATAPTIN